MRFLIFIILLSPTLAFSMTVNEAVALALQSSNLLKQEQVLLEARGIENSLSGLLFAPSIGVNASTNFAWTGFDQVAGSTLSSNPFDNDDDMQVALTGYAKLNLFNGFYDYATFGMAGTNYDAQDYKVKVAFHDTIYNARMAFIDVLKAEDNLIISKENLKLLRSQLDQALINFENGLFSRKDVLQVESFLATAELERITAESNLNIAILKLENTIDRKIAKEEVFIDILFKPIKLYDFNTFKDLVFTRNSSIKSLEMNLKTSEKQQTIARKSIYPLIDLSVQYNKYWGEGDFNSSSQSPIQSFTGGVDSRFTAGVTASWDIIQGSASILQAKSKVKETMALSYSIADIKNNLILDLQSSIENYNMSIASFKQATLNVYYTEENYNTVKLLYDEAAATTTELLDASVLLNRAKVDRTAAIYSIVASVYRLERMIEDNIPLDENNNTLFNVLSDEGLSSFEDNKTGM